ncbi:hypothetical protein E4U17_001417 [Claviceps sp. LM77 group G4]|nr:hypothetical protein E4U17_001417 [Claviceps sp. LM77 group G4]KAG6080295.1 hypothetical protein E4U33_007717 [Claviceps sp. LM78 group G4]KAG6085029.1 hypothetical protein E4U16_000082 [Claviceps sp. LM84 group G4]
MADMAASPPQTATAGLPLLSPKFHSTHDKLSLLSTPRTPASQQPAIPSTKEHNTQFNTQARQLASRFIIPR